MIFNPIPVINAGLPALNQVRRAYELPPITFATPGLDLLRLTHASGQDLIRGLYEQLVVITDTAEAAEAVEQAMTKVTQIQAASALLDQEAAGHAAMQLEFARFKSAITATQLEVFPLATAKFDRLSEVARVLHGERPFDSDTILGLDVIQEAKEARAILADLSLAASLINVSRGELCGAITPVVVLLDGGLPNDLRALNKDLSSDRLDTDAAILQIAAGHRRGMSLALPENTSAYWDRRVSVSTKMNTRGSAQITDAERALEAEIATRTHRKALAAAFGVKVPV